MRGHVTARVLRAYRNRHWHPAAALAELLDNAFGEQRGNASRVWIRWNQESRTLAVMDNGQGMIDLADLFIFGSGETACEGDIGLYGVGGSEALVWLSDYTDIATLRDGKVSRTTVNYAACIQSAEFPRINNRWRQATATNCPLELLGIGHGTLLVLSIRKDLRIHPDVLQDKLSRLFSVGLRTGRHISWTTDYRDGTTTDTPLHPWDPGRLEDVIQGTVTADGGQLSAIVTAGRVDGLSVANSKLSVNYLYRQIKETTAGFGRPVQGLFGTVDLSPGWLPYLTTTKDDIREDCRQLEESLMANVATLLKPLIERLQAAKRTKIFTNIRISLKHKFERGFEVLADESTHGHGGSASGESNPGADPDGPRPPREQPTVRAAQIDIQQAHDHELDGMLCRVLMEHAHAVAYINIDHPLVVTALDAEPVNQLLLEQLLIPALAKEIVEANALVTFGLLSKRDAAALLERFNGNAWDVLLYLIRYLTDGVVEAA